MAGLARRDEQVCEPKLGSIVGAIHGKAVAFANSGSGYRCGRRRSHRKVDCRVVVGHVEKANLEINDTTISPIGLGQVNCLGHQAANVEIGLTAITGCSAQTAGQRQGISNLDIVSVQKLGSATIIRGLRITSDDVEILGHLYDTTSIISQSGPSAFGKRQGRISTYTSTAIGTYDVHIANADFGVAGFFISPDSISSRDGNAGGGGPKGRDFEVCGLQGSVFSSGVARTSSRGTHDGQINRPSAIAIDSDQNVPGRNHGTSTASTTQATGIAARDDDAGGAWARTSHLQAIGPDGSCPASACARPCQAIPGSYRDPCSRCAIPYYGQLAINIQVSVLAVFTGDKAIAPGDGHGSRSSSATQSVIHATGDRECTADMDASMSVNEGGAAGIGSIFPSTAGYGQRAGCDVYLACPVESACSTGVTAQGRKGGGPACGSVRIGTCDNHISRYNCHGGVASIAIRAGSSGFSGHLGRTFSEGYY
ncbi:MAG: hypothetical protein LBP92_08670 [Deltaproteobacteria bacterium]|nr:hypothetical protein [Deltaproteobacteria bacterium]